MSERIDDMDLLKSIERLEALSKGQIVTGGNSDPKSWAGSTSSRSPEWSENTSNGTDYSGGRARKSREEAEAEVALAKAQLNLARLSKGGGEDEDEDEKGKKGPVEVPEDEMEGYSKAICPACSGSGCDVCMQKGIVLVEDESSMRKGNGDVSKSFSDRAFENDGVREGYNVSTFLRGMGDVIAKSLTDMEQRLARKMQSGFGDIETRLGMGQQVIAKGMADVLRPQANMLQGGVSLAEAARAPRSVGNAPASVNVLEKSFAEPFDQQGAGINGPLSPLQKSLIATSLGEMAMAGEIPALEVVKFESSGVLSGPLAKSISARLGDRLEKAASAS